MTIPKITLIVRDDLLHELEPLLEIFGRRPVPDAQIPIHAEMVPRHHEHAFFLEQAFNEHRGVDREIVTHVSDGAA